MRTSSPQKVAHGDSDKWDTTGVMLPADGLPEWVDLPGIFGRRRPVEIEIGSGKGTFLLARAQARPEIDLLGIEYARAFCTYAADRIRRQGLSNVRMLCTNAEGFFPRLADGSVWRVHVYFPDPWPKRKHHRRRLIQPAFLEQVCRVLPPGGQLLIVTDHREYFEQIRSLLHDWPRLARVPFPRLADRDGEIVGTNFERKYIAQGRPFYSLARLRY